MCSYAGHSANKWYQKKTFCVAWLSLGDGDTKISLHTTPLPMCGSINNHVTCSHTHYNQIIIDFHSPNQNITYSNILCCFLTLFRVQ